MKKNLANADRIIRLLLAIVIAILYFTNIISGTAGIVLLALSIIFAFTSVVGYCPIYAMLRFSTYSKKLSRQ